MKRILLLSRYGFLGASSRLRFFQFLPVLEKNGFTITVCPFFNDDCINRFYKSGKKTLFDITTSFVRRFFILLSAKNYDFIWLEKESFPFLPGFFEAFLHKTGIPYIIDFDDAIFHSYDAHNNRLVRSLLGKKLDYLIKHSSAVTVGNSYLAEYMLKKGAKQVEIIPTVVDIDRYNPTIESTGEEFRIGWIGTPKTSKYLHIVKDSIEKLSLKNKIRFVTVGAPLLKDFSVPLEQHDWSEETETEILNSINVGIMPLYNGFWEQGKCSYKLIQYMACGRAVIASPVGMNIDVVKKENGLSTNSSNDNWLECFEYLIERAEERCLMGFKNRSVVEQRYSLQAQTSRILGLFN